MSKELYSIEDFVMDAEFRDWVLHPSAASNVHWQKWLKDNPDKKEVFSESIRIIKYISRIDFTADRGFSEMIWDRIQDGIKAEERSEREVVPLNSYTILNRVKKNKNFFRSVHWIYGGIAASLLLILSSLFYLTDFSPVVAEPVAEANMMTKSNPSGQKSTIILPDGTIVTLNSESSISFLDEFSGSERRVNLVGEAFFEVTRNEHKPFIVESGSLRTIALGTSFDINAYPDQNEKVILVSGKVRIENTKNNDQSEILNVGEMVNFQNGILNKSQTDPELLIQWKNGIINFQDTPLKEALAVLERWYGVRIDVVGLPRDGNMNFTGTFDNDYLSNVLRSLSYTMSFDYSIDGKNVTINFK